MIPKIPTDDIARITRSPTFTSATYSQLLNGRTEKAESAVNVEMIGADQEDRTVGVGRDDVFLEQKLQGIRDGLQKPVRADAHGPEAHLKIRQHLAFDQYDVASHQWGKIAITAMVTASEINKGGVVGIRCYFNIEFCANSRNGSG